MPIASSEKLKTIQQKLKTIHKTQQNSKKLKVSNTSQSSRLEYSVAQKLKSQKVFEKQHLISMCEQIKDWENIGVFSNPPS